MLFEVNCPSLVLFICITIHHIPAVCREMNWPVKFHFDLLAKAKQMMEPVFEAVTELEGQRYLTLPVVLLRLLEIKGELEKNNKADNFFNAYLFQKSQF